MSIEVKVPVLPESVADATIASWHKKAGDHVRRDENLVDLETDKVVLEVPAPADGVLKEIRRQSGETVNSEEVLAILEPGEAPTQDAAAKAGAKSETRPAKDAAEPAAAADAKRKQEAAPAAGGSSDKGSGDKGSGDKDSGDKDSGGKSRAPAGDTSELPPGGRRFAKEHAIDPAEVQGSGRGGRVTKEDLVNYQRSGGGSGPRPEERVKMTRIRQRIAERMMQAKDSIAMLTSFNEVNLGAVMKMRKEMGESFEKQHGVRLGFMSFFVKAAAEALKRFPVVNASVDGEEVVYHGYADISIAVSTERGLVTPVLRNAESMSFADVEHAINDYATRARSGALKLEDLQGGTFTITNGGVFGSLFSTPIVNPPQSAILGMHTIKERPVAENGQVTVAPMMYIALSYDHRIVDGKDAVQFLVDIKNQLENPHRMLLGL